MGEREGKGMNVPAATPDQQRDNCHAGPKSRLKSRATQEEGGGGGLVLPAHSPESLIYSEASPE